MCVFVCVCVCVCGGGGNLLRIDNRKTLDKVFYWSSILTKGLYHEITINPTKRKEVKAAPCCKCELTKPCIGVIVNLPKVFVA